MGMKFLIDTNIIIHFFNNEIPEMGKNQLKSIILLTVNISIISKIELLGFTPQVGQEQPLIEDFVHNCTLFHLTDEIAAKTIELRKQYRLKIPDAIIAATAMVNNMTLISRNDKDFQQIKHLKYINPFRL